MKNYVLIFLVLAILISWNLSKKTTPDRSVAHPEKLEERVEFMSQNDTLVGYLSKPPNDKKYPLIVVLHSASHGQHDSDLYNHLEKNMNAIGIGVFTYDRRGSGESGGDFNSSSLETLSKDALNAIKKLKARNDIAQNKIGLFGISQGGWIAPLAYSIEPDLISFMILLSSSGVSPARQMEYSAVTTLKMNGYSQSIVSKAKHLRYITNEYYRGNRAREITQMEIDKYKEEAWFPDVYLPWRGNLPEDVGTTKWIHEMDFNPEKYFKYIDIPILLFYGQTDRWVPIEESIKMWRNVFNKNGNSENEIYRINRTGHMMIIDEDNNPKQQIVSEQYTNQLKQWVIKITK